MFIIREENNIKKTVHRRLSTITSTLIGNPKHQINGK